MGLNVFLVEDEMLIALMVEDMLEDMGHTTCAVAMRLALAMETARGCAADFALLDINLSGALSFPVAHILKERGIPFAFTTGYEKAILPEPLADVPVLGKPFSSEQLSALLNQVVSCS